MAHARLGLVLRHLIGRDGADTNLTAFINQDVAVLCQRARNGALILTLNRPRALNSLTLEMIQQLDKALTDASVISDSHTSFVVVRSNSEKAFCAGGDIRALAIAARERKLEIPHTFFHAEYCLNYRIATYSMPYIAILDGITMGGGVGISISARYRIVSDRLVFAMPETGIGFFPDVGGSYFLSKLPGSVGMYMALTGTRLRAADAMHIGIGTHYVPKENIRELEKALSSAPAARVQALLDAYSTVPPREDDGFAISKYRSEIDVCFDAPNVETIISRLEARKATCKWAAQTLTTLHSRSPLSLKVTYEALRRSEAFVREDTSVSSSFTSERPRRLAGFAKALAMELRIAMRFMETDDFYEGVRAQLIDKDGHPRWKPASLSDVSDAMVSKFFAPFENPEWELKI